MFCFRTCSVMFCSVLFCSVLFWRGAARHTSIVSGIRIQYQCDLMDTQTIKKENDMYAYVLLCIDIFSKMAYARPLKNKTSTCVIPALKIIFNKLVYANKFRLIKELSFLIAGFKIFYGHRM